MEAVSSQVLNPVDRVRRWGTIPDSLQRIAVLAETGRAAMVWPFGDALWQLNSWVRRKNVADVGSFHERPLSDTPFTGCRNTVDIRPRVDVTLILERGLVRCLGKKSDRFSRLSGRVGVSQFDNDRPTDGCE